MIHINYPIYNHNILEIKNLLEIYNNRFKVLEDYIDGKISVYDNILYLDKAPIFLQPLVRSYYKQDRYTLKHFLENEFNDYNVLLIYIFDVYRYCYSKEIYDIISNLLSYNNILKLGIHKVGNLYSNFSDFHNTINNIERMLYDYDCKCRQIKIVPNTIISEPKSPTKELTHNLTPNTTPNTSPFLNSSPSTNSAASSITSSLTSSFLNFTLN